MSNDPIDEALVTHDELPEVDETNPLDELPHDDEQELLDDAAASIVGEDVASQDLSMNDLLNDGVPFEDLEPSNVGRREMEADLADEAHEDTIEERMRQEEPEEGSAIVAPSGLPRDEQP